MSTQTIPFVFRKHARLMTLLIFFLTVFISSSSFGATYLVLSQNLRFETVDGLGYCNGIKVIDQGKVIFGLGFWNGCGWSEDPKAQKDFTDFEIDKINKITNTLNNQLRQYPKNTGLYLLEYHWDEDDFSEFMIPELYLGPPNGNPLIINRTNLQ